MKTKLTKKQMLIVDFIKDYTNREGESPSYREIMSALGLTSVSAVAEHINNLVTKGALRKIPGTARSLEVIDLSHPETTELFRCRLRIANTNETIILHQAADILGIELGENNNEADL